MHKLRSYLMAGLLVWLPIIVTLLIIRFIIGLLDGVFGLLPAKYQPDYFLGVHIPGLGIILSVIILLATGLTVTNFLGKQLVGYWDALMARIPLVRSIHSGVKQILHTMFTPDGPAFRKVLLVEYPRRDMWSIAFQTGKVSPKVKKVLEEDMVTIFIPTTPNPTSGFLMIVPRADTREVDLTVDEALKMVISLGVVQSVSGPLASKTGSVDSNT